MKSVKCLLFVVGMFCLSGISAQADLRLDSVVIGINSSVYKDSVYNLSVTIFNDSATDFIGVINIGGTINGQPVRDSVANDAIYYANNATTDTVPHNSQITRTLVLNLINNSFIVGTSGVVIWPIAVSTTPHLTVTIVDSIGFALNILYPVGIDELSERDLKVYMSGQRLVIQNSGAYLLKDVKLYDVAGKLLLQKNISVSGMVDMNEYSNGVYFAEINFADNTRAIVKVVNTR
jgi:hypothetical protein